MNSKYPEAVCWTCGYNASKDSNTFISDCATWSYVECDVCGAVKSCTEPRDFGYPKFTKQLDRIMFQRRVYKIEAIKKGIVNNDRLAF